MNLIEKICEFFAYFVSYLKSLVGEEDEENETYETMDDQKEEEIVEEKINAPNVTLLTRLYILEQQIEVFKLDFPNEYASFLERINLFRETYNTVLKKSEEAITFDIDPEIDSEKISEVDKIERDINSFIESEVKFHMIVKRIETLITKVNILYNVSIKHQKENDKSKVITQLQHAKDSEIEIIEEIEESEFVLQDKRLKDRILNLISYLDYEILKTVLRNSDETPEQILCQLPIVSKFEKFDVFNTFKAYILDEVSDLRELLQYVDDKKYCSVFERQLMQILKTTSDMENMSGYFELDFWKKYLDLESTILEMLKMCGVAKENMNIKILDKMDVKVKENDVITLPKTKAVISLTQAFYSTKSENILLVIKLFQNLSSEVTYKEIYFLLLLFDAVDILKGIPNGLGKYIEKYEKKYPYSKKTIEKKKDNVIAEMKDIEYFKVFEIDSSEKEKIIKAVEKLNLVFKIENNDLYICSFYFNGLDNVISSLQTYTTKTI